MAITRTQIAKQLLAQGGRTGFQGGGADMGRERGSETGRAPGPVGGGNRDGRDPSAQFGKTPEERAIVAAAGAREMAKRDVPIGLGDKLGIPDFFATTKMGLNLFKVPTGNQFAQGFRRSLIDLNRVDPGPDRDGGGIPYWAQLGFNSEAEYLSALAAQGTSTTEPEPEKEEEGLRLAFRAEGGRIGFRGGEAARSDAASGRNAGRADPSGGVDDRSNAGQTEVNNAAIMMARMQNNNLNEIKNPNSIEKFPSGIRAIDKMNLDKMIANMNLNPVTTDDDDEDTNVIDTVFSEKPAADLQTVYGTGLSNRQQTEKNILGSMADGGRAGLAGGGMPYEGGIMDLESARQMYGLGKLVKKITRSVKKVAKSPIGKAALFYAGGAGLSALGAGSAGTGFGMKMFGPKAFASNLGMSLGKLGLGSKFIGPSQPKSLVDMLGGKVGVGILGASAIAGMLTPQQEEEAQMISDETGIDIAEIRANPNQYLGRRFKAEGGSTEAKEPVAKKVMPLLDMEGQEKDYRETGGFVDMGRMEKADDVPARLSKNEFVFTADAVRNAGDGSVDKGAEVMYNMMKNLESGGDVSEESQGLEGARKMFQTSQRLEEVL